MTGLDKVIRDESQPVPARAARLARFCPARPRSPSATHFAPACDVKK